LHADSKDKHFTFVVIGCEIDWWIPLAACSARGMLGLGIALAIVGFGINKWSSSRITIGVDEREVYVCLARSWPSRRDTQRWAITGAELRHWQTWSCRGLALRTADFSLVASTVGGRRLKPTPVLNASRADAPAMRLRPEAILRNLPNLVVASMSVLGVAFLSGGAAVITTWLGLFVIVATVAASLRGAPCLSFEGG
jgi:hypothetical protein